MTPSLFSLSRIEGVALSADIYVDIIKRKKILGKIQNIYDILPTEARRYAQAIDKKDNSYRIPIVLDMESATVFDTLETNNSNTEISRINVMRIVLDTIYDENPINFRKDVKAISKEIAKWFIHYLVASSTEGSIPCNNPTSIR